MRTTRRTGALALAASLALTAGVMTAVLPASAAGPGLQQDGTLTLSTSSAVPGQVSFPGLANQPLTTTGACDLANPLGGLIVMRGYIGSVSTANAKNVGYLNGSIGVNEKVESLCNKVDNQSFGAFNLPKTVPEILELTLGDSLKNFEGRPMWATSASLDMELRTSGYKKEPALVEATLWETRDGSPTQVDPTTYSLAQGTTANDGNISWKIAPTTPGVKFDTIRLKAVKGDFSLEGGADSGSAPTTFNLVSEVSNLVACDADPLASGNASVVFAGNAEGSTCTGFGVSLTGTDQEVTFLKPLTINPDAQFIFDIDWKLARPATPAITIPEATIDFEFKDDTRAPADRSTNMPFCPDYLYTGGKLTGLIKPPAGESTTTYDENLAALKSLDMVTPAMAPSAVGTQFACIGDSRTTSLTSDNLIVTDKIYLIGDAKMALK